ncbi:peptidase S28 [Cristinia sonorae]|uniref:Peptidase S28 n=1 Tax=Cristinia sonorae TaxID=1940300 RepID=A0A8K0XSR5_9AGAR|nr:peptidase S28 [Cristinia sonorae]
MASTSFKLLATLLLALLLTESTIAVASRHWMGAQGVNLWRLNHYHDLKGRDFEGGQSQIVLSDGDLEYEYNSEYPEFRGYWFRQPLDHFDPDNYSRWRQRYWINTRHYRPNTSAPVIVLDGGETNGADRLPFLDTGIVDILAKATGGIGVVLEHRYYGTSYPVYNFTTDALRFLNNSQSLQDSANFMANVKFAGVDEDVTAPNHPWIYYGGSYAGARAAHMRVLYPDLVYGAIASSGVTHASLSNWEYMEVIRKAADPKCSESLVEAVKGIDALLETRLRKPLKDLFGLGELEHDDDFVSLISDPLGSWQAKMWDPSVGSTGFDEFCDALTRPIIAHANLLNDTMTYDYETDTVSFPNGMKIALSILNYAKYVKEEIVSRCPEEFGVEECFGTHDDAKFQSSSILDTWRLWIFQVCTEWGYFSTAPPDPDHPRIVSKLLTLEYESMICKQAFPAGDFFTVPAFPNVTTVNVLGDFDIAADRLAIIDGEVDPWRPCTPHSEYAKDRDDTILRPFKLIPNGVHHYDEWGLANIEDEPTEILKIHREMIHFVKEWLKDWESEKARGGQA